MSQQKKHHILSRAEVVLLERKITEKMVSVLRYRFKNSPTAVKNVADETGVALTTVKKWYEGRNPPSLGHFLILCRHYEDILEAFLSLSGNGYLISFIRSQSKTSPIQKGNDLDNASSQNNPENVTINVTIKSLNERQRWFLDRVFYRITPSIEEFIDRWNATERTARRDIAALLRLKLIKRVGARKNGRYEVI